MDTARSEGTLTASQSMDSVNLVPEEEGQLVRLALGSVVATRDRPNRLAVRPSVRCRECANCSSIVASHRGIVRLSRGPILGGHFFCYDLILKTCITWRPVVPVFCDKKLTFTNDSAAVVHVRVSLGFAFGSLAAAIMSSARLPREMALIVK
ncbi:unnamed protein product [Soboliphyme baturini]|uniref:ADH_N domain-containing protein n=1 Tax=Soboliphyme baturini TaxID=241478 RepID=A0A183ITF7_9BILA|nr:unnamed protein product [Soboliphyme baturini]